MEPKPIQAGVITSTPIVLTIAGFDPSNGAGVTADLQVFAAHGLFGMSAITALTVQSTQGVAAVEPVSGKLLRQTLQHLAADVTFAGVKAGMLGSREAVIETAAFLRGLGVPMVLDTVLHSSSGATLLDGKALAALREELLPIVGWVTPNWAELAALSDVEVDSLDTAWGAMEALGARYPSLHIVATGGDREGDPVDLWRAPGGEVIESRGQRVETTSTHGTGCAFSSALLSRLVRGHAPGDAVRGAKAYVEEALRRAPGVGRGRGPLGLLPPLRGAH